MKKTPLLRNDLFLREGYLLLCDRKAEKSTIKSSSQKKKKIFLHACMRVKKKRKFL